MRVIKNAPWVAIGIMYILAVIGCADNLSRSFYAHHPRSVEEVESVWGAPVAVTRLNAGLEKRTYAIQSPYTDLKYRYFLIKDGAVLASGITDSGKMTAAQNHDPTVTFVPSDLSQAFYLQHRTTVTHLDQTWGQPLGIENAADGNQYRVYAVHDPYTDFKYRKFILKDGIVVASRISPEEGFGSDATKQQYRGIEINDISHRYYANHPMSLEAVETVWGAPVCIQKADNGVEKRTYKLQMPVDAAFAFRFFIIEDGLVVSSGISDTVDVTVD